MTKHEIDCELLMLSHDYRRETNNAYAHMFRSTLEGADVAECKRLSEWHVLQAAGYSLRSAYLELRKVAS